MKIEIVKNIKGSSNLGKKFFSCEFEAKINNSFIDYSKVPIGFIKKLKRKLNKHYFDVINGIIPEENKILVCLSGSDNDIPKLVKEYFLYMGVIAYYIFWPIEIEDAFNENNFVYIICDRENLKKIFKEHWFSFKIELDMKIYIMDKKALPSVPEWSNLQDEDKRFDIFLNNSLFVIENIYCGFSFRISSNKKGLEFFESIKFESQKMFALKTMNFLQS